MIRAGVFVALDLLIIDHDHLALLNPAGQVARALRGTCAASDNRALSVNRIRKVWPRHRYAVGGVGVFLRQWPHHHYEKKEHREKGQEKTIKS